MLKRLTLDSFRKHERLVLDFSAGLVVIQGANEAAKSTIFEAISYALFGSAGLREALAAVVTWGKPEAALGVKLDFSVGSAEYSISRKKSGAELNGEGLLVTGQAEVTRYVERLLKTNASAASNLLLASQGKLRGALTEKGKAVELISELADFDLIDRILALIQNKLPTGNTKSVSQLIDSLTEQIEDIPPLDILIERGAMARLDIELTETAAALQRVEQALTAIDTVQAGKDIALHGLLSDRVSRLEQELAEMRAATATAVCAPPVDLDALRAAASRQQANAARIASYKIFLTVRPPEVEWEGSQESLLAAIAENKASGLATQKLLREAEIARATRAGRLISETTCGLCGKDLADIPEVTSKNLQIRTALAQLDQEIVDYSGALQRTQSELNSLMQIKLSAEQQALSIARCGVDVELHHGWVPPHAKWLGNIPSTESGEDSAQMLAEGERKFKAYQQALGVQQAAAVRFSQQQASLSGLQEEKQAAEERMEVAKILLKEVLILQKSLTELQGKERATQAEYTLLQQAIVRKQDLHAQATALKARILKQIAEAQETFAELERNNVLVKKIQQARPVIADSLWESVLAAVSSYFSSIRGELSVVSREENSFLVGGRPITGLSGSTLDGLGLAVRVALVKTFLPEIPFLLLDEPAAACDNDRETNMLGMLATANFDQIILITHSSLCDSLAAQIIQLQ